MSEEKSKEPIIDNDWGCLHSEYLYKDADQAIKACLVKVERIDFIANQLVKAVLDTSWIMSMDYGTQLSYDYTAKETADVLVNIFKTVKDKNSLGDEFGEVMVSIGSSRALNQLLKHVSLPIAELWKPQVKQNEGFDFHTVCENNLINFGEAKFSASINPHGNALTQAVRFLEHQKHHRDRVHLVNLVKEEAIVNLDKKDFGIVAAFSINSDNCEKILDNAIKTVREMEISKVSKFIYLVGVKC
ncbi:hypothetical protein H5A38_10445 [Pectobacterium brasiliense]|uniref:hypothetical protein n=1 Tax=Pectobacterium brasiliense TaxID=180957 RepID=UPI001968F430|nr:hypothetical protein [Pectobacterium brasiliense]QSD24676.1 hypothetical protein H5A38_10445 [Pectobacterium brasiliense]